MSDLAKELGYQPIRKSRPQSPERLRIAEAAHAQYDRLLAQWQAAESRGERLFISSADYHAWELVHDIQGRRVPRTELSSR